MADKAVKSPHFQPVHLGKLRCDFMIDQDDNHLKLVEYNTIATGMGICWQRVRDLQDYLQKKYPEYLTPNVQQTNEPILGRNHIFENDHSLNLATAFKQAMDLYHKHSQTTSGSSWCLIVVEDTETNVGDQKMIEDSLYKIGVKSMRVTLLQVASHGKVLPTGSLEVFGREIALVYYRTGYSDHQFKTPENNEWCEKRWLAREMLECSLPVKAPSILGHITTLKKY